MQRWMQSAAGGTIHRLKPGFCNRAIAVEKRESAHRSLHPFGTAPLRRSLTPPRAAIPVNNATGTQDCLLGRFWQWSLFTYSCR